MPAAPSVLITGASSGIGRTCALRMDALGWKVFAGVRKDGDAGSLRADASARLVPLYLDVTDFRAIEGARQVIGEAVGPDDLAGLVNNATTPYGGPVEALDLKEFRRAFEVNFFGVVAVIQAFLPLLREARGRIVNMSSISGLTAAPYLSPYSTSKFALEALSDALRVELHSWGIHVAVIEPGAVDTPIWHKAGDQADRLIHDAPAEVMALYLPAVEAMRRWLRPHGITSEHVARAVGHALTSKRPKTRYLIGPDARAARLFRLLPDRWRDRYYLSWPRGG